MPDTARLIAGVCCSACGATVLNSARFQWGGVPGPQYLLGDAVRWVRDKSGAVLPPFVIVRVGANRMQWNCGAPSHSNVILFDQDLYSQNHHLDCPGCSVRLVAAVAYVRDSKFDSVQAVPHAELRNLLGDAIGKANEITIAPDGSRTTNEEWFDHTVTFRDELGLEA